MRIIIISDSHLKFRENTEDKLRRKTVIKFLDSLIGKTDLLILNGDIFDIWVSWSKVIIKGYFPVLKKLADLNESGTKLIFIAGNHDFWFGDFLKDYLGFEIFEDYFYKKADGKKIFVTHGDKYTANDLRYKIFRYFVRNKRIRLLFKLIHPDLALTIGNLLSRSSRERRVSSFLSKKKEKGLLNFAKSNFNKYDIVVLGHSHTPLIKKIDNKYYINSGDWIKNNSYVEIINGNPQLKYFEG